MCIHVHININMEVFFTCSDAALNYAMKTYNKQDPPVKGIQNNHTPLDRTILSLFFVIISFADYHFIAPEWIDAGR